MELVRQIICVGKGMGYKSLIYGLIPNGGLSLLDEKMSLCMSHIFHSHSLNILNRAVSSTKLPEKDCSLSLADMMGETGGSHSHECPCHGID